MIATHRGAFEYDWRARFHLPLRVIGRSMTWGEALRLAKCLAADPSSAVGAALSEFDYPISRETCVLMEVYDSLEAARIGRKAKRHPRPWPDQDRKVTGSRTRMTVDALRALLDSHRNKEGASDG